MNIKGELLTEGFAIVESVLSNDEVDKLLKLVKEFEIASRNIAVADDLFAIRQFFKMSPSALDIVLTSKLLDMVESNFGADYFIVKSIYFDKPPLSNWFVSYHQDLTISVDRKSDVEGFGFWTSKQDHIAVRPPLDILEDNFTVRLHLDDTTRENGALKVVPSSHLKGIVRPEALLTEEQKAVDCEVPKGGAMFMKPLLMHSSGRTINGRRRRVLHIEYSRKVLPDPLKWAEKPAPGGNKTYAL